MERLENLPPVKWALIHPRIAAWTVLSLGMVILLVIEARDVGLQAGQWIALIVATVLVAGACIWIVSWEDAEEGDAISSATQAVVQSPSATSADEPAESEQGNTETSGDQAETS